MADRKNQHFVPQYYFRFFSENDTHISSILKRDGRLIPAASIRGQCAGDNFYGSKELESFFSTLESKHSRAHRAAIDVAWNAREDDFTAEEYRNLLELVTFQRSRTLLEIEKSSPAKSQIMLDMFRHHLVHSKHDGKEQMVEMIDGGAVKITEHSKATVVRIIDVAMESVPLISDLEMLLLRNRTDYPFIFGDAPVIHYNTWARDVKDRGVLGTQCPGLQIFYPLDSGTCLVLFDPKKYSGPFGPYLQYDIHQRSDVSSINALQLYHSSRSIYFGPADCTDYVQQLWGVHKDSLVAPRTEYNSDANFWVDGKPPEGKLMHSFEPQLAYELNLSFFECNPVSRRDYTFCHRSPDLVAELDRQRELQENREQGVRSSDRKVRRKSRRQRIRRLPK